MEELELVELIDAPTVEEDEVALVEELELLELMLDAPTVEEDEAALVEELELLELVLDPPDAGVDRARTVGAVNRLNCSLNCFRVNVLIKSWPIVNRIKRNSNVLILSEGASKVTHWLKASLFIAAILSPANSSVVAGASLT